MIPPGTLYVVDRPIVDDATADSLSLVALSGASRDELWTTPLAAGDEPQDLWVTSVAGRLLVQKHSGDGTARAFGSE